MNIYQVVKIPTNLDIVHDVEASSIKEVREWIDENLDTTTRWIIKLDDNNIGDGIISYRYSIDDCIDGFGAKTKTKRFNSTKKRAGWFMTIEEAQEDYNQHKPAANKKLDKIQERLEKLQKELGFIVDYHIDGDTQGIHDEFLYISVKEFGYTFYRKIESNS